MATLTGQPIDQSYSGLLKTTDNAALSATAKAITDGIGGATNQEMSNTATNFVSGTVDFTGATVSGLPGGAAGLENGTGTSSLQSAASLTTTAANASSGQAIAIGDAAIASSPQGTAIGKGCEATGLEATAIGNDSDARQSNDLAIGRTCVANGGNASAIGANSSATASGAVALGNSVTASIADTVSVKALETQADGGVQIKGDGTNAGKLKLFCENASGAHNVTLEGPAHSGGATYGLKFPNVQSAGTQILEADSSGNLAWINTPVGSSAFNPISLTGLTQDLDLGQYNFFRGTLTGDTTLTFSNIPAETEFQYSFNGSAGYSLAGLTYLQSGSSGAAGQDIHWKPDGTQLYLIADGGTDEITAHNVSTPWDISTIGSAVATFDHSAQSTSARGLSMSLDGTKMYITAESINTAFEYTLATAFDITTATYSNNSLTGIISQPWGTFIHPTGASLFISGGGGTVQQWDLSTPFDLSTASLANSFNSGLGNGTQGVTFKPNGLQMFLINSLSDKVFRFDLSTAWDLSTATNSNVEAYVGTQATFPYDVVFKSDGSKMYVINSTNVLEYDSLGAAIVTLPTSVQNPPTYAYTKDEVVTWTFYTLDTGVTVYLSNNSLDPAISPPGLVTGSALDSIQTAASLTTIAADASGLSSISIGDNTEASGDRAIAIGENAKAIPQFGSAAIAIGQDVVVARDSGIAIGKNINQSVSTNASFREIAIGNNVNVTGGDSIALGTEALVSGSGNKKIAIGFNAEATVEQAVAIGANVTASTANTVSVNTLEVQTDSTPTAGGIIMSDAGGTDRRINIDATGNLQVDSVSIAGKAFSFGRYAGTQSTLGCDTIQASVLIPGGTFAAGDILQLNALETATGGSGWCYTAFWLSTDGTIGNSGVEVVNIAQTQTPDSDWKSGYQKSIYIHTTDGTGAGTTTFGTDVSDVASRTYVSGGDSFSTSTPNWANDLYLVSRVCIDNAGSQYTMHGATLRKTN